MISLQIDDLIWPDQTVRFIDGGFPLSLDVDQTTLEEVKILLVQLPEAGYALGVWTSGRGNGPELGLLERVTEIQELTSRRRQVTLLDSGPAQYAKSRKCGCGSRLRSYSPWPAGVTGISVPKPSLPASSAMYTQT